MSLTEILLLGCLIAELLMLVTLVIIYVKVNR